MNNKDIIKSYTDLAQSKILTDILSFESADMYYDCGDEYDIRIGSYKAMDLDLDIPCWSLAALRACLPPGIDIDGILYVFESHNTFDNKWVYEYKFEDISAPLYSKSSNEIDAVVDMIIQLKENKMI